VLVRRDDGVGRAVQNRVAHAERSGMPDIEAVFPNGALADRARAR
jgi:hypothetical protein